MQHLNLKPTQSPLSPPHHSQIPSTSYPSKQTQNSVRTELSRTPRSSTFPDLVRTTLSSLALAAPVAYTAYQLYNFLESNGPNTPPPFSLNPEPALCLVASGLLSQSPTVISTLLSTICLVNALGTNAQVIRPSNASWGLLNEYPDLGQTLILPEQYGTSLQDPLSTPNGTYNVFMRKRVLADVDNSAQDPNFNSYNLVLLKAPDTYSFLEVDFSTAGDIQKIGAILNEYSQQPTILFVSTKGELLLVNPLAPSNTQQMSLNLALDSLAVVKDLAAHISQKNLLTVALLNETAYGTHTLELKIIDLNTQQEVLTFSDPNIERLGDISINSLDPTTLLLLYQSIDHNQRRLISRTINLKALEEGTPVVNETRLLTNELVTSSTWLTLTPKTGLLGYISGEVGTQHLQLEVLDLTTGEQKTLLNLPLLNLPLSYAGQNPSLSCLPLANEQILLIVNYPGAAALAGILDLHSDTPTVPPALQLQPINWPNSTLVSVKPTAIPGQFAAISRQEEVSSTETEANFYSFLIDTRDNTPAATNHSLTSTPLPGTFSLTPTNISTTLALSTTAKNTQTTSSLTPTPSVFNQSTLPPLTQDNFGKWLGFILGLPLGMCLALMVGMGYCLVRKQRNREHESNLELAALGAREANALPLAAPLQPLDQAGENLGAHHLREEVEEQPSIISLPSTISLSPERETEAPTVASTVNKEPSAPPPPADLSIPQDQTRNSETVKITVSSTSV